VWYWEWVAAAALPGDPKYRPGEAEYVRELEGQPAEPSLQRVKPVLKNLI
jgi:hypothetical protein